MKAADPDENQVSLQQVLGLRDRKGIFFSFFFFSLLSALLKINSHLGLRCVLWDDKCCLKAGEASAQSPCAFSLNFRLVKSWEMKSSLLSGNPWGSGKTQAHLSAGPLESTWPHSSCQPCPQHHLTAPCRGFSGLQSQTGPAFFPCEQLG